MTKLAPLSARKLADNSADVGHPASGRMMHGLGPGMYYVSAG